MCKPLLFILALLLTVFVQGQVSRTFTGLAPGELNTKLTVGEFSTITDLTLSGSIDARDFLFIRQKMPALAAIDLSNVTVAAYTGKEGLEGNVQATFPANALVSSFSGNTSLTSVVLPQSITMIGENAFFNCKNLKSVTMPSALTSIGKQAFMYCPSLTSLTIPATVTDIGQYAFSQSNISITVDAGNQNYSSAEGILFNKDQTTLIYYPPSRNGDYIIPATVKTLENGAFVGCTGLKSVKMPDSVTSIGAGMFAGCTGLQSVILSNSITRIGELAFSDCKGLTSIIIPNSVTTIEKLAFSESGITSITLSNSLTRIEDNTFQKCKELTSVIIPNSVTTIGATAFVMCSNLKSVTLPDLLTRIGIGAFYGCSLTSIYTHQASPLSLSSAGSFDGVNKTSCNLYVPAASVELYKAAPVWKTFTKINDIALSSAEDLANGMLTAWPNPANDQLTVNAPKCKVCIYNSKGQLEITQSLERSQRVNISSLARGIYTVSVEGQSTRIIKQ